MSCMRSVWPGMVVVCVLGLGVWADTPAIAGETADSAAAIEPSAEAKAEYQSKLDALADDDVEGRLALAQWCEQSNMPYQAMDVYRQVLKLDFDHEQAYEQLVKLADENPLPASEALEQKVRREIGPDFRFHRSPSYLIAYDANEEWVRNRGALLEKAHDTFYENFRSLGFRVLPLEKRLVCVLFAKQDDYRAFAQKHDSFVPDWASGYYSHGSNFIVFYDDRDSPRLREYRQKEEEYRNKVKSLRDQIAEARKRRDSQATRRYNLEMREAMRNMVWWKNRAEARAVQGDTANTIHEAAFQLSYNSELQVMNVTYPMWVTQGIGTTFETEDPARPFGPLHANVDFARALRDVLQSNNVIPLETFVTMSRGHSNGDVRHVQFVQSWALFRFLIRYKRDQLQTYLAKLAEEKPDRRDGEVLREEFIEAFGPIKVIEKQWLEYCRRTKK